MWIKQENRENGRNRAIPRTGGLRGGIAVQFGEAFRKELFALEAGRWAGPLESPFGVHLIRIDQIVDGQMPTLDEIRGDVKRDWLADRRETAQQGLFDQMRAKYSVTIETYEAPER